MSDDRSGISSDLDWMLHSNQADEDMLLDTLVHAQYIPVYRLANAILNDDRTAHQAAMKTMAVAISDSRRRRRQGDIQIWLYGLALKTIAHQERNINRTQAQPAMHDPNIVIEPVIAPPSAVKTHPSEAENRELRLYFDSLGHRERLLLILFYLLELPMPGIATLLRVSQNAVLRQLDISRSEVRDFFQGDLPDQPRDLGSITSVLHEQQNADLDQRLSLAFQTRWPGPVLSDQDWQTIHNQVKDYEHKRSGPQRKLDRLREGMFIGIVIVLLAGLVGAAGLLLKMMETSTTGLAPSEESLPTAISTLQDVPQEYLYIVQPGESLEQVAASFGVSVESLESLNDIERDMLLVPGQQLTIVKPLFKEYEPDPTKALPKVDALNTRADSERILQHIRASSQLWRDLWMDVQIVDYGAVSFIGDPRIYRAQAWISQPDYSLELFGMLAERPSSIRLVAADKSYTLSPDYDQPLLMPWEGEPYELLETRLRKMVFPDTSNWANREGFFQPVDLEQVAGRQAVIVDWLNTIGQREARLWLDSQTAQILRLQEFGGPDFQILLAESVVTGILFEPEIPAHPLFEPANLSRQGYSSLPGQGSDTAANRVLVPEVAIVERLPLPLDPAPPELDPAARVLSFQVSRETLDLYEGSPSTTPTELFADAYYLGTVAYGLPWGMRCNRSYDGQHLAFMMETDGVTPPDHTLRWMNLREPREVYEPMPDFQAYYFAFAPDSQRLAVFGRAPFEPFNGVYILDLAGEQSRLLLRMLDVRSLVWSPDGIYLAIFGQEYGSQQSVLLIVHVRLAEVTFRRTVVLSGHTQEFSWSELAWNLEFPLPMGGMDACAVPPGQ